MSEKYFSVIPNIRKQFLLNLLNENKRFDNRNLNEYRSIKIKVNCIPNSNGSAEVSLGNTIVLTGIKIEETTPFPTEPEKGTLIVNAEFPPVASPEFEPGPPDENAIELARIIDRGLRKPEVLNFESLCITKGEKVFGVWVDIYILNHDGNLIDAAGISVLAALLNTKYLDKENKEKKLEIKNLPVFITHAKIGKYLLLDPTFEEEYFAECKLITIISSDGKISGIQKVGFGSFYLEEIDSIIKNSIQISSKIRDKYFIRS